MTEELKNELIKASETYLNGTWTCSLINGFLSKAKTDAQKTIDSELLKFLEDWIDVNDSNWNEWGHRKAPISDEDYKVYLKKQIETLKRL